MLFLHISTQNSFELHLSIPEIKSTFHGAKPQYLNSVMEYSEIMKTFIFKCQSKYMPVGNTCFQINSIAKFVL